MYFSKNCRLDVNVYKRHKIMYIIICSLVFPFSSVWSETYFLCTITTNLIMCVFDVFHSISRHQMMPWGHIVVYKTQKGLYAQLNRNSTRNCAMWQTRSVFGWGRPMMLRKSPTLSLTVGPCCVVLIFTLSILILFLLLKFYQKF